MRTLTKDLRFLLVCAVFSVSAQAAILMSDDFDSITTSQLNVAPTGWTATNGTVDSLVHGSYGLPCLGGSGGCVDLDGSTGNAADFSFNTTFNLSPGVTYTLTYHLPLAASVKATPWLRTTRMRSSRWW